MQKLGLMTLAPCLASRTLLIYQTKEESLPALAWHYKEKDTWSFSAGVTELLPESYKTATRGLLKSQIETDLSRADLKACLDELLTSTTSAREHPVIFEFVTEVSFTEEVLGLISDQEWSAWGV